MRTKEAYHWIEEVIDKLPNFIENMQGKRISGFFRYSWSGDIYSEDHWGVGNTVFAAKILFMIKQLTPDHSDQMAKFIYSFQQLDGSIYDPLVKEKSRIFRLKNSLISCDFNNLLYKQTKRAETRQAFASLCCLARPPINQYEMSQQNYRDIEQYINNLNWREPWGACSHISHLAFFLNIPYKSIGVNDTEKRKDFSNFLFKHCEKYRQKDGSWYAKGTNVSLQQKINGAMKMVTAYQAAEKSSIGMEKELIDLCLTATHDTCACDNFNIICVLNQCIKKTNYRIEEIEEFAMTRLKIYNEYFWPKFGGFSFMKGKANAIYYGAHISKGLAEPDIHGTVLFLWGIVLISGILNISDELNLQKPIT